MARSTQTPRARVAPGYEHEAQPKAHGKKNYKSNTSRRRVIPNLNLDSDKEARTAWREKKKPTGQHTLPSGFDPQRQIGSFESFRFIQALTGTHFALRKLPASNCWEIEIWGTEDQVQEAKDELFEYDKRYNTKDNKPFARVDNNRGIRNDEALHEKLRRIQKRQKFCQKLSEDELTAKKYGHVIVVPWPEKKWQIEDALGQQLEALDEIRMDCLCYIHFSRQGSDTNFVLLGDHLNKLKLAASRLQGIPARILSHSLQATQFFLLKPLPTPFDYNAYKVAQIEYYLPKYTRPEQKKLDGNGCAGKYLTLQATGASSDQILSPEVAGITSLDELEEVGPVWMGLKYASMINTQYLNLLVSEALKHLTVFRGHISMDVTIGTCVFQKHRVDPVLSTLETENILLEANRGDVQLEPFMATE